MGVSCNKKMAPKAGELAGHTHTTATAGGGPAKAVTMMGFFFFVFFAIKYRYDGIYFQ